MSSTKCLWRSSGNTPERFFNSSREPITLQFSTSITSPDGNRVSPVPVAGNCPFPGSFQPFTEPSILDMLGHPVDLLVGGDHAILDLGNVHEPGRDGPVDEGGLAAPAMGVCMEVLLMLHYLSFLLQALDDGLVRILYKGTLVVRHLVGEPAFLIDRTYHRNP